MEKVMRWQSMLAVAITVLTRLALQYMSKVWRLDSSGWHTDLVASLLSVSWCLPDVVAFYLTDLYLWGLFAEFSFAKTRECEFHIDSGIWLSAPHVSTKRCHFPCQGLSGLTDLCRMQRSFVESLDLPIYEENEKNYVIHRVRW